MQMIDVLKRLAELDASNPNVVNDKKQGVAEELKGEMHPDAEKVLRHIKPEHHKTYTPYLKRGVYKGDYRDRADVLSAAEKAGHTKESVAEALKECGIMDGMDRPSTPASINMTAATGEELSGMLKDIMTLAGMSKEEPISTPALSVVEPASDGMGPPDQVDFMRSTLDKLNPTDDDSEDDEERKVDEYDNEPNPQGTDYSSMTPTGDDLASKGGEAPKVNGGGNPMQRTVEEIEQQLLSDYQKFMNEGN